jgi:hypothetical protein
MNNFFQKQPATPRNATLPANQTPPVHETPINEGPVHETPPISDRPTTLDPQPSTPKSSSPAKPEAPPLSGSPSVVVSQAGPIYPPEAVDIEKFNSAFYDQSSLLKDIRNLFSKQIVVDKDTTITVNTISVPGFIGVSDEPKVQDPKGNLVSGYADMAALLKTEELLISTYQGNPNAYGKPIDLSYDNGQSEEIAGAINRRIEGQFKGSLEGIITESLSGEFSGQLELVSQYDADTMESRPALKLKGNYDGTLKGRFDGTLQGQMAASIAFDRFFIQDSVIKNEGLHAAAIVPSRRMNYETNELIEGFATFNQPASYHGGVYGGNGLVSVAQRLVFDEVITPEEATGYRHSIINWLGLLSHVVQFADRNIDGGDPTTVIDKATLKTILQNGLRASLGYPEALAFFDDSNNKLYCAEFIYIGLNTPLFPFNEVGLTALLDGDSATATAVLGHQTRYANAQFDIFSLIRPPGDSNPELVSRNILLPPVSATLLPMDQLLTQRGRIAEGLPFPPFTISQVIRRAFKTLLPPEGTLEASQLAKLQIRLFKAIEPMLMQQVLPSVDFSTLTEEAAAAIQADPRVQQVKAFITKIEDTLKQTTDITELDRKFDEIIEQSNSLIRQAGALVEFVPPRIYVDLGQRDGDTNLPTGWGFQLETIGATIARQSINGAVPPAGSPQPSEPAPTPPMG